MKNFRSTLKNIGLTLQYLLLPWTLVHKYEQVMRGVVKAEHYATFLSIFNGNSRDNMCIALMSRKDLDEFQKKEVPVVPFEGKANNTIKRPTLVKPNKTLVKPEAPK